MLTQERAKELLDYDPSTGVFTWKVSRRGRNAKAGMVAGSISSSGYRMLCLDGKSYSAHRVAWLWWYGKFPENHIDHVNRIKDDNRIGNLLDVTPRENGQNLPNHSPYGVGVHKHPDRDLYEVRLKVNGKRRYLGYYKTPEEARDAYWEACAAIEKKATSQKIELNSSRIMP